MKGNFWQFLLKLVSANPPNRQTLSPKKKVVVTLFKIGGLKICLVLDLIMAAMLKVTRRQLCLLNGGCKNLITES